MGVNARCPSCDAAEIARYERVTHGSYRGLNRHSCWVAVVALISLAALLLSGCATGNGSSVAVTVNVFGSLSRFGQSLGGTNTQIRGQIEGGGGNSNQAALTP